MYMTKLMKATSYCNSLFVQ